MPILILTIVAQLFCAWHVINSGRDKYWIWLIIMAPGIGCLIYLVTQLLPDASDSRTGRAIKQGAVKALDPNKELREARQAFDMLESVENRIRLADALYNTDQFAEAEPHLRTCLAGAHKHDPHMLMRLAAVRLEQGFPDETLELLDTLQANNKNFHSQEGHLLYSRALQDAGNSESALDSYAALVEYATGEEARFRHGSLLKQMGYIQEAQEVLQELITRVDRGTKFYKKTQKKWRDRAVTVLSG